MFYLSGGGVSGFSATGNDEAALTGAAYNLTQR